MRSLLQVWTRKWPNPQRLVNAAQRMLTPSIQARPSRCESDEDREFAGMQEAPPPRSIGSEQLDSKSMVSICQNHHGISSRMY